MASFINDNTITSLLGSVMPTAVVDAKRFTSTKHPNYVQISLDNVRPMQGFTQANIQAMYEDLLSKELELTEEEQQNIANLATKNYAYCTSEDCVNWMLSDWFSIVVERSIAHSTTELHERFNLPPKVLSFKRKAKLSIRHPIGEVYRDGMIDSDNTLPPDVIVMSGNFFPDWVFLDTNDLKSARDDTAGIAHIIGEGKISIGFNPRLLECLQSIGGIDWENAKGDTPATLYAIDCLKQIGTYAWLGQTRYAFIATEKSTAFLRFFLVHRGQRPSDTILGVEYSWVNLTSSGTKELTMSNGMHALAMMAQNEKYRRIVEKGELEDLRMWYYVDLEGDRLYFHPISRIITNRNPDTDFPPTHINLADVRTRESFFDRYLETRLKGEGRGIGQLSESDTEFLRDTLISTVLNDRAIEGHPPMKRDDIVKALISLPDEVSLLIIRAWMKCTGLSAEDVPFLTELLKKK
ncbi:hypothetical protein O1611_g9693 [Lasiodiplodia mahajangana]|uniref:Uncharacterized protein n=1 Tax=Lasiodiplodia mahajangana TaxID=1108764 RepID=A0ACC2J6H7_9PEZI|nr:hypothetical protein O1611_g9693 [Lasiodiplodia mahajangana]